MRQAPAGLCLALERETMPKQTPEDPGVPQHLLWAPYSSHILVAPTVETHPSRGAQASMPRMPPSQSTALSGGLRGLEREEEWENGVGSDGSWPAGSVLTSL